MANIDWVVVAVIFVLRATDVALGTIRVMYTVRGHKFRAAALGLLESLIFIFAISRVFKEQPDVVRMLAYAAGFAAGILMGVTIEGWIASGFLFCRIISRAKSAVISARLRERAFGVTSLRGEGREGELSILFIVAPRRRRKEILEIVRAEDEDAFITLDSLHTRIGGHVPHAVEPAGLMK